MSRSFVRWVIARHCGRPDALLTKAVRRGITAFCPLFFTERYYAPNRGRRWNGREACFTLSFDCDVAGDIEALPRLLGILGEYRIPSAFACVGRWIEREPGIHARMLGEGHEILNHSYSHPSSELFHPGRRFNQLAADEQEREIAGCHEVCRRLLGYAPEGFRTPHFGNAHTPGVDGLLEKAGYRYSSSRVANQVPCAGLPYRSREKLWEFPVAFYPREPFQVFETWRFFRSPAARGAPDREDEFFLMFAYLADLAIRTNSYLNLYFDPVDVARFRDFGRFLRALREREDRLWVAPYGAIARALEAARGPA